MGGRAGGKVARWVEKQLGREEAGWEVREARLPEGWRNSWGGELDGGEAECD